MRTHMSIGALVCLIGMTSMARDAEALAGTFDQTPGIVSFADSTDLPLPLPLNIVVSPDLRDIVAHMLRESEVFRRQCELIGRMPHLRVHIVLEEAPGGVRAVRAQTDLVRYEFGSITARVRVWVPGDAIELIAHELEHVIEVGEGINYRALLVRRLVVWSRDGSAFETARAIQLGLEVKREVWFASPGLSARR
jgi:hypothetical protein